MSGITSMFSSQPKPKTPPVITPARAATEDEARRNIDAEEKGRRRKGILANMTGSSVLAPENLQSGGKTTLG